MNLLNYMKEVFFRFPRPECSFQKRCNVFLCFFFAAGGLSFAADQLAVRIDIQTDNGILTPVSRNLYHPGWEKKNKENSLIYNARKEKEG